ncbi:Transmembrane protein OS=Tsukamurella paurometabola (strain ATCC 8368 / DSM / CCUG 35730 / CIP 100753 / JCM 10117 / KCTC 9821 / NBRC 16120 / NCIMB 702349/ NCTC 13040) OX=521096 GN=Tpau_1226 PE=4 SV=1 [Tsukamurella paurometabola]|uniref:Transmembrane protein n=1 Tax=Tsukamurella paurometabola (strain ATCC 8368 / DSM 20162 / CCUG 35730 / CIP 100753 / JCM 10117 / KCTC 9821 / NBRC 16120 / NCIMB 702349 / NCTC 13040) TaxID=521096 RepID=D5UW50_TSUPD|nr:hypothetical protein [Tsukamurella paurometabola]ADG77857.1 hypothetical protein Tpau_1226 [Tsukamurella paurometabola DSM 20162]SUP29074.1 Uncharacterised protein [Tsukamurella paurometabola]
MSAEGERSTVPAQSLVGAALVLPAVAFVLLWQVRDRLDAVYTKAQTVTVSVPDDMTGQAIRFVIVAAVLALVALFAASAARMLSVTARMALTGCTGTLLVHAAVLAPDIWLHDPQATFASYLGYMIVEGVLFAIAVVAGIYQLVFRALGGRGA